MFSAEELNAFFDNSSYEQLKRIHKSVKVYFSEGSLKSPIIIVINLTNAGRVYLEKEMYEDVTYHRPKDTESVVINLKHKFRGRISKKKIERDLSFLAEVAKEYTSSN